MSKVRLAYGPYATADGRLTDEGKAFVDKWLEQYPKPGAVFTEKYGRSPYFQEILRKHSWDFVNAECCEAVVKAALHFQPSMGWTFQTYAVHWMRGRVSLLSERRYGEKCKKVKYAGQLSDVAIERLSYVEVNSWDDVQDDRKRACDLVCELAGNSTLTLSEKRIAIMLFPVDGELPGTQELAARTGLSPRSAIEMKKRVIRKLQSAIREKAMQR